jgi:hypothetical protein
MRYLVPEDATELAVAADDALVATTAELATETALLAATFDTTELTTRA